MRRPHGVAIASLAALMFVSGCYGPFYLVRKVHRFNGEVSDNKWVVEVAYLLMAHVVPVYGIAGLADAIIFNSIEFWTGNNPLAEASADGVVETKKIARNDGEVVFKRVKGVDGDELVIEQFQHGQPSGSLRLVRQADGTVALDDAGKLLYRAQTLADGGIAVHNAEGKQIAKYSGEQVERMTRSVRQ